MGPASAHTPLLVTQFPPCRPTSARAPRRPHPVRHRRATGPPPPTSPTRLQRSRGLLDPRARALTTTWCRRRRPRRARHPPETGGPHLHLDPAGHAEDCKSSKSSHAPAPPPPRPGVGAQVSGLSPGTRTAAAASSPDGSAPGAELPPPSQPDQSRPQPGTTTSTTPVTFNVTDAPGDNFADTTSTTGLSSPGHLQPLTRRRSSARSASSACSDPRWGHRRQLGHPSFL